MNSEDTSTCPPRTIDQFPSFDSAADYPYGDYDYDDFDDCDDFDDFGLVSRRGGGGASKTAGQKMKKRQKQRGGGGRGTIYSTKHIRAREALLGKNGGMGLGRK